MFAQTEEKKTRGLYRRNSDADIYTLVGTFPLACAAELARLTGRPLRAVQRRLARLHEEGYLNRIQGVNEARVYFQEIECEQCRHVNKLARMSGRQITTPWFWYLTPKGEKEALKHADLVVAWSDKSRNIVDHDRALTLIHLALREQIVWWVQTREDMKQTVELEGRQVNFYADARFLLTGMTYFLEYQHSAPSSRNGETDLDVKVERYNALLKDRRDAKVIFVFTDRNHVENFLKRIAGDYPYRWLWATDIERIKHDPAGKIFWCPKDFDTHTYSFSDTVV
jgi:hypothetical protein